VDVIESSVLDGFLKKVKGLNPLEIGQEFGKSAEIAEIHNTSVYEGQSVAPALEERVGNHFVAFVPKNGNLYELEGCREFPINHGPTTPDTFLEDAAAILRNYMKNNQDDLRFSVVALTTGNLE